jgi:hypothetical protein
MIYLANLIEALGHLSDVEFQRRAWLASKGSVFSSFAEDAAQAFDDTGLAAALDSGQCAPELDEKSVSLLKDLRSAVARVRDSEPPERMLTDPQVERVRQLAARALAQIQAGR